MHTGYRISLARLRDLPRLGAIERAAAALLSGYAPQSVLDEATSESEFRRAHAEDRLWVVVTGNTPVGFALIDMLADDLPHLEEIDVDPEHGRRGLGAALVRTVCDWICASGYSAITLTTFRNVAWNMPFYSRMGFEEVPRDHLRPELAEVVRDETARGLDPQNRVVMRWRAIPNKPAERLLPSPGQIPGDF